MYLQITTRCNMSCPHCGFACTTQGEDMSLNTFRDAIRLDAFITLGGGEPTLHPHFDTILLESLAAVAADSDGSVYCVTNGSITRRAMVLAQLAKSEVLSAQLSQDDYHDAIDPKVVEAFESIGDSKSGSYKPGIRNTTLMTEPHPHGRAIQFLGLEPDEIELDGNNCLCSTYVVKPNGDIYHCACHDSPKVGDVKTGTDGPPSGECCHSSYFVKACLENEGKYEHLLV